MGTGRLVHILTRKLESFIALSEDDDREIHRLTSDVRVVEANTELVRQGDRLDRVHLLIDGWAYRYKVLPNGRRQILALLLPGDMCDIHGSLLKSADHSIALLGRARVAFIPHGEISASMASHSRLQRAFWWTTLVDEAILREWLVNIGQRDALQRVAHLLSEVFVRAHAVGLVDPGQTLSMPLTQVQLGETVGLTPVAVNRALQRLRADGIISLEDKQLTVHAADRLAAVSGFSPSYLHRDRRALQN